MSERREPKILENEAPQPEVLQIRSGLVVVVGMALWAVALVATLVIPSLREGDRWWWPWVCVAAIALGPVGLAMMPRSERGFGRRAQRVGRRAR